MPKYHTLVSKVATKSPWEIEFGDYDKQTVKDEERELRYSDSLKEEPKDRRQFKIITTNDDSQATIEAAVSQLNRK